MRSPKPSEKKAREIIEASVSGPTCPRCGKGMPARGALSRRADVFVCDMCGQEEAMEDAGVLRSLALCDWAII